MTKLSINPPFWNWDNFQLNPKSSWTTVNLVRTMSDQTQWIQIHTRCTFTKNINCAFIVQQPTCPNCTKRFLSRSTPNLDLDLDLDLDHPCLSANFLVLDNHFKQLRLLLTSKHLSRHNKILIYKLLLTPVWSYDVPNLAEFPILNGIQIFQSKRLGQMELKVPYMRCTILFATAISSFCYYKT